MDNQEVRSRSVQDLARAWLTHLANINKSPATVKNYTVDVTLWILHLERKSVHYADVDCDFVDGWLAKLRQEERKWKTISRKVSAVRGFYRWLKRRKLVTENPFDDMDNIKHEKRLPEFLTEGEVNALFEAVGRNRKKVSARRDRAILETLYATGCRVAELCGLDLTHVSHETGTIRIFGKGMKERIVPVTAPALEAIKAYLPDRLAKLKKHGRDYAEAALFINQLGTRMRPDAVLDIVVNTGKAAGIKKHVHPHMLRHSIATHLHDRGLDIRDLQEFLGHENIATTQIYTHVSSSRLAGVVRKAHPRG